MEGQIPDLYVLAGRLAREEVRRRANIIALREERGDEDVEPLTFEEIDEILDESEKRAASIITDRLEPQFAA